MMEYNNYYPVQTGHHPHLPTPTTMSNQAGCLMIGGPMTPNSVMHSSPAPSTPHSMRHTPGPSPMQHHHSMNHHQHQQPSPHSNYHQLPPHPMMSHSASPHHSTTPLSQGQPSPRPSTGPSPLHQHSPIHMNGQPTSNMLQSNPITVQTQSSNLISPGSQMHSSSMTISNHQNHSNNNSHHHQNHQCHQAQSSHQSHYSHQVNHSHQNTTMGHQNVHLSRPQSQPQPQAYTTNSAHHHSNPHYGHQSLSQQTLQAPSPADHLGRQPAPSSQTQVSVAPPPRPSSYAHPTQNVSKERKSPFYQNMPPAEFRMIELNKRLQNRPRMRTPSSPLPFTGSSDEGVWWDKFTSDFFDDEATLALQIPSDDKPIEYTIGRTLIPRFFKSYFDGGVTDLSIKLKSPRETQCHPNLTKLDCDAADIITKNVSKHSGTKVLMQMFVHTEGHLYLEFVSNSSENLVIKSWRFYAKQCHEYIDRSMINSSIPNAYLMEPMTRFGLTESTCFYLRMCLVMEPMQDLMAYHKQTRLEPRVCLKNLLYDKYKIQNLDDKSGQTPKRRKRTRGPANASSTSTKKTKANSKTDNNSPTGNNIGLMTDPEFEAPGLPLASLDVLVLGEPSMLGADFSDGNERQIARIENKQSELDPLKVDQQVNAKSESTNLVAAAEPPSESTGNNSQSTSSGQTSKQLGDDHGDHKVLIKEAKNDIDHSRPGRINSNDTWQCDNNDLSSILAEEDSSNSSKKTSEPERPSNVGPSSNEKITPSLADDSSRPVSEEFSERGDTSPQLNGESSNVLQVRSHLNQLNCIPEDREDTSRSNDIGASRPPPSVSMAIVPSNGCQIVTSTSRQNRRRSSERREMLREGLMRAQDFVIKIENLKDEHPVLWRITTANNLLQQFEPKSENGSVVYENTHQYHGWNPEIERTCIGVDVKLTQQTRNQITVERLLLNFQKLDDPETFFNKHFLIYLQILISTALDPKFWDGIESDLKNRDYFVTSRKIIEDIIKRHKLKLSSKLKLSEVVMKNFEKYPNLMITPIDSDKQGQPCRACNTNPSTQNVKFGDRSYDLHSYKPVKVTSEPKTPDNKDHEVSLCDACMNTVQLYSEVHHLGWRLFNVTLEKIEQLRSEGKPVRAIMDECLMKDEDWINKIYFERDSLWSRIETLLAPSKSNSSIQIIEDRRVS